MFWAEVGVERATGLVVTCPVFLGDVEVHLAGLLADGLGAGLHAGIHMIEPQVVFQKLAAGGEGFEGVDGGVGAGEVRLPDESKVKVPVATGLVVEEVDPRADAGTVTLYVQVLLAVLMKLTVSVCVSPNESVTCIGVENVEVASGLAFEFRFMSSWKFFVATGARSDPVGI